MKTIIATAVACLILLAGGLAFVSYAGSDPSTEHLDQDLVKIANEISTAEAQKARYDGGAITSLIEVRIETLKVTAAMLEQKRLSLLRRIDLNYTLNGELHQPDERKIAAIGADLAAATSERDRLSAEASRYTGGLVQAIALANAATAEFSISQLRLALLSERYGFTWNRLSQGRSATPNGQEIVEDGDAL